ncbi:MAG: hypothetical protein V7746_19305 [Halioglobus sp.]
MSSADRSQGASLQQGQGPEIVESRGAWWFATRLDLRHPEGRREVKHSRYHRKHLASRPQWETGLYLLVASLWMPRQLNWWIGVVFAVGASLFVLGCVLFLYPSVATAWSISENQANAMFFAGSIPFTTAAYLQLFQAANAGPMVGGQTTRRVWIGWYPGDAGWLSCALQFAGTVLFNFNTFDAMLPELSWWQQDLLVWVPDLLGSILFLSSGYLAWIEICHAHWAWEPDHISWWIGGINLLGCIAFMISALFAFIPAQSFSFDATTVSLVFTLLGAIAFLLGAMLLLPESVTAKAEKNQ